MFVDAENGRKPIRSNVLGICSHQPRMAAGPYEWTKTVMKSQSIGNKGTMDGTLNEIKVSEVTPLPRR